VDIDIDPDLIQSPPQTPKDGPWLKSVNAYYRKLNGKGELVEDDEVEERPAPNQKRIEPYHGRLRLT
jgi:hypothetical protein